MQTFDYAGLQNTLNTLPAGVWLRSVLGRSVCGREIPILIGGQGKNAVVYVAAHHGMERLTTGILTDFAVEIAEAALTI